jgi:hypothetical protein
MPRWPAGTCRPSEVRTGYLSLRQRVTTPAAAGRLRGIARPPMSGQP